MRGIIFFIVLSLLTGLIYFFVDRRLLAHLLVSPERLRHIRRFFALLMLTPMLAVASRFFGLHPVAAVTAWPAFVMIGIIPMLVTLMLIRELVVILSDWLYELRTNKGDLPNTDTRLVEAVAADIPEAAKLMQNAEANDIVAAIGRRDLLMHSTSVALLGVTASATGYGGYQATRIPDVKYVDVSIRGLPAHFDGLRIVQITDIHVGPTIGQSYVEAVAERVAGLGADLIVNTGDLVDGTVSDLASGVAPLHELQAPLGKFFVTGNHEYYSGVDDWVKYLDKHHWGILHNSHVVLERQEQRLMLAGITDHHGHRYSKSHQSDPHAAVRNDGVQTHADPVEADARILLAHQPRSIKEAAKVGFDLQLSGHTHGGQFYPIQFFVPMQQPYMAGLYRHNQRMQIYVSRGTGYWGPPVRLGAPSEITLLKLKRV